MEEIREVVQGPSETEARRRAGSPRYQLISLSNCTNVPERTDAHLKHMGVTPNLDLFTVIKK